MHQASRLLFALGLLTGGAAMAPSAASAAAQIRTQEPCTNGGDNCFNFGAGIVGLGQFDLRSFTYKAPSKGNAEVSFHGSLLCAAEPGSAYKVVDLVTQITNTTAGTIGPGLPGGLRQATVLAPNTSNTLNLASTRMFTFKAAGTQTYHYRVRPLRIDSGSNCYVYNAAFTVVFIP